LGSTDGSTVYNCIDADDSMLLAVGGYSLSTNFVGSATPRPIVTRINGNTGAYIWGFFFSGLVG